jgi:hypothetical protein
LVGGRGGEAGVHEKTRAAAAPRKPKKGAVSSPLNVDDILAGDLSFSSARASSFLSKKADGLPGW